MTAQLFIFPPVEDSAPWQWVDSKGNSGMASNAEERSTLADIMTREIIVIIPGQWVRVYTHDLPKMRETERLSAAAFSIEDQTAAPLQSQHIVLGAKDDDRLAVITGHKIQNIVSCLTEAGLNCDAVYTDYDALSGSYEPIRLSDRIIVPGPGGHTLDAGWDDGEFAKVVQSELPDLISFIDTDTAINLRQGRFAQRAQFRFGGFSLGRAAALLAIIGLSWGLHQGSQARALNQQASAYKTEAAQVYKEATGKPAPANLALAVRRAVKGQPRSGAGFLTLSNTFFQAIDGTDGVMIDVLQFNADKQELTLRLVYPAFESAGELERIATELGAQFRPGGVREQGGELIGDAVFTMDRSS